MKQKKFASPQDATEASLHATKATNQNQLAGNFMASAYPIQSSQLAASYGMLLGGSNHQMQNNFFPSNGVFGYGLQNNSRTMSNTPSLFQQQANANGLNR